MFPMIDQGISKVLDAAMKKGDFETFRTTFEAEGLDASGLLYSRARKNAWPLVKRALDDPFKKTTVGGKLDIARYLMGKGADLNVSAPWGILFVGGLVYRAHIGSKWEVRLEILRFITDVVMEQDVVLDARAKGQDGKTDLDEVFWVARWEFDRGDPQILGPATLNLIDAMLDEQAPMTEQERYLREAHVAEHAARAIYRRDPMSLFARATELPAGTLGDAGEAAWSDEAHERHAVARAVGVLRDRAFRHHGWGWAQPEDAAITLLRDAQDALAVKAEKSELKKAITKLSKPDKPVFDEDLYARVAQLVTEAETTRALIGMPSPGDDE